MSVIGARLTSSILKKEADPEQRNYAVQVYRPTERAEKFIQNPKKIMEEQMDRTGENVATDRLQPPPRGIRVTLAALSGHDLLPPEWTYLNIRCGGFLSN